MVEHERNLERSRDLLARSQQLADVGAWEYDVTEGIVRTTPQQRRILGLQRDGDLALETVLDVCYQDDRDRLETALERAR